MAAGAFTIPYLAKLNMVNATNLLLPTRTFKLALVTSSWTPVLASDELWSTPSAYEVANGQGYTTGGITVTGVTLSVSGSTVIFTYTGPSTSWTASGTGIPAWKYGVLYASGTINSKANPLLGYFLGDSGGANIPLTTAGNTLTILPSASGVIYLS